MIGSHKQHQPVQIWYFLVALLLFVYVLLRAILLDITYDEAWTIFDFVPATYMHILNYTPPDTNNHILNSMAVKLCYSILPNTVFVARIPNVIAFLSFLYYAIALCQRFFKGWLGLMVFLVLSLNPFALDFFSLARGYGMMLGMQLPALFYLLAYFENKTTKNFVLAALFSLLMILSNLSSLYFFLGWMGVFLIHLFVDRTKILLRMGIGLLAATIVTLFIWEPIRKLIEVGGFYVGGTTGFYHDTLQSLTRYSMCQMERSQLNEMVCLALCVFFTIAVVLAMILRAHSKHGFWICLATLVIAALATVVQHYALGGLYLVDRTALFFYPLIVLSLFFAFKVYSPGMLSFGAGFSFSLLVVLNFAGHANFYKSLLWYFDSHTTEVFEYINNKGATEHRIQKLDYSWPFESSVNYHLVTKRYPFVANGRKGYTEINDSSDYYLYLGGTLDAIHYEPDKQLILKDSRQRDTVFSYPGEKVYLFKLRKK